MRFFSASDTGEHRLIHMAPQQRQAPQNTPQQGPKLSPDQLMEQALQRNGGDLNEAVKTVAESIKGDQQMQAEGLRTVQRKAQQRYEALKTQGLQTKDALEKLKTEIGEHVELKIGNNEQVEVTGFKTPAQKPGSKQQSQEKQSAIPSQMRKAVSGIAEGFRSIMEKYGPMIQELVQLLQELRDQMKEFMEDMMLSNRSPATKDRQIEKQIANENTTTEVLRTHESRTIARVQEWRRKKNGDTVAEKENMLRMANEEVIKAQSGTNTTALETAKKKVKQYTQELETAKQEQADADIQLEKYENRLGRVQAALKARGETPKTVPTGETNTPPPENTPPKKEAEKEKKEQEKKQPEETPEQKKISEQIVTLREALVDQGKSPEDGDVKGMIDLLGGQLKTMKDSNRADLIKFLTEKKGFVRRKPLEDTVFDLKIEGKDSKVLHILSYNMEGENSLLQLEKPKENA